MFERFRYIDIFGFRFFFLRFVDEPLRWLMANNKHKEATSLVRKAGKKNGVKSDTIASIISQYFSGDGKMSEMNRTEKESKVEQTSANTPKSVSVEHKDTVQAKVSNLAVVKHPRLRRVTLVMLLAWSVHKILSNISTSTMFLIFIPVTGYTGSMFALHMSICQTVFQIFSSQVLIE